jgi:hypothetical protein
MFHFDELSASDRLNTSGHKVFLFTKSCKGIIPPGLGRDPAVSGELRSLGSNEEHEVGLRRLRVVREDRWRGGRMLSG